MVHSEDDTFLHSNIHKRNYQLFMNVCFLFLYWRSTPANNLKLRAFCCRNLNVSQFCDFYLKIFIQVRFVVVFLIFVHKATSVFFPMDQKKICVNPSHDCVSSPLLQSSLVLSLFNVSVEIHSYTQLWSKLGINVYKPHHSQEWSVQ